ncbi:hypothetical protein Tco_0444952 [Tanacetum coccineum]
MRGSARMLYLSSTVQPDISYADVFFLLSRQFRSRDYDVWDNERAVRSLIFHARIESLQYTSVREGSLEAGVRHSTLLWRAEIVGSERMRTDEVMSSHLEQQYAIRYRIFTKGQKQIQIGQNRERNWKERKKPRPKSHYVVKQGPGVKSRKVLKTLFFVDTSVGNSFRRYLVSTIALGCKNGELRKSKRLKDRIGKVPISLTMTVDDLYLCNSHRLTKTKEPINSLSMGDEHLDTLSGNGIANFLFDDDHIKEKSSGSTTTHADFSKYDSFIFDLSINPFPPADRSDFYHEEFADELAHIISPSEYDHFCFKIEPELGNLTMDEVEDIFPTRVTKSSYAIVLNTHPPFTWSGLLLFSEPLFAYIVWIFLPFLTYPVALPYLLSCGNEDTIFDPGISVYHSILPGISHRSGTFVKFNVYPNHLTGSRLSILFSLDSNGSMNSGRVELVTRLSNNKDASWKDPMIIHSIFLYLLYVFCVMREAPPLPLISCFMFCGLLF